MARTAVHASIAKDLRRELETMIHGHMERILTVLEERLTSAVQDNFVIHQPAQILPQTMDKSIPRRGQQPSLDGISRESTQETPVPSTRKLWQLGSGPGASGTNSNYLSLLPQDVSVRPVPQDRPPSARDLYQAVATEETTKDLMMDDGPLRDTPLDVATFLMLIVNAVADAIEVDYQARQKDDHFSTWYKCIQFILCIGFVWELVRRVRLKGRQFFTTKFFWHYFQIILVIAQTAEMTLMLGEWWLGFPYAKIGLRAYFRLISMIRILRVFNILDHLDYTTELHLLLASMHGSLWSLCWSALFMLIPMFVFGMVLTQVVAEFRINSGIEENKITELMHYFGSLDRSMLSLFWSISGGLSWSEAMIPLKHYNFVWPTILFVFYVASMVFAVLNVLTGVFVNSATSAATSEKERRILNTLQKIFKDADDDESGNLTYAEFTSLMKHKDIGVCLQSLDIRPAQANHLFELIDADQSGVVEIEEFLHGCDRLQGSLKAIDFATFSVEDHAWKAEVQEFMKRIEGHFRTVENLSSRSQQSLLGRSLPGCLLPSFT